MIQKLRQEFSLAILLDVAQLPRATFYYHLKQLKKADKYHSVKEEITAIFHENKGRYGYRRITAELRNRNIYLNHKTVQRLMQKLGLVCRTRMKKYRSYKGEVGKVAGNIIQRNFKADRPLQKWTTDVTQFHFSWGKCYLSPILDMNTNEIISYDLSMIPNLNQIKRMLNRAFKKFRNLQGLIMHSDQGWQYQHEYYRSELKKHGIIQSMSRKGNCYDNSIMETFFGRMKNEMYYGSEKEYTSFKVFAKAVKEYIHYFNKERIQKKTKWMPPEIYRETSTNAI
mgnify:CR=1 FL=1